MGEFTGYNPGGWGTGLDVNRLYKERDTLFSALAEHERQREDLAALQSPYGRSLLAQAMAPARTFDPGVPVNQVPQVAADVHPLGQSIGLATGSPGYPPHYPSNPPATPLELGPTGGVVAPGGAPMVYGPPTVSQLDPMTPPPGMVRLPNQPAPAPVVAAPVPSPAVPPPMMHPANLAQYRLAQSLMGTISNRQSQQEAAVARAEKSKMEQEYKTRNVALEASVDMAGLLNQQKVQQMRNAGALDKELARARAQGGPDKDLLKYLWQSADGARKRETSYMNNYTALVNAGWPVDSSIVRSAKRKADEAAAFSVAQQNKWQDARAQMQPVAGPTKRSGGGGSKFIYNPNKPVGDDLWVEE